MSGWRVAAVCGLWAIPGLLAVAQYTALDVYKGQPQDLPGLLVADFLPWQLWAAATPLIVWLGRRWPVGPGLGLRSLRHLPVHVAANAAIGVSYVTLQVVLNRWVGFEPFAENPVWVMVPPMALKSTVFLAAVYWGVIAADRAWSTQQRLHEAELQRVRLESRLVEAQLDTLRIQLRPHFLFNTLNAIVTLVRTDDKAAAVRMILGLSELLRRSLEHDTPEVSLREELDFVGRYVEIQLARFSDRLQVTVDADPAALDATVPSLLLQPLVENALDHGIAPRASGGKVELTARVVGPASEPQLQLEVRDDGVGLADGYRDGVGLSHLRSRLAQLFPGRHRLELAARPGGGTVVTVELPLALDPA
ncbi:MAG: sensor histidine kinase [Myxococcota bacterium]